MKELIFIATTKKLTQKCLRISSSFVIIFWTGSSLFRQTLMLRRYLYIKVSLTLHSWMLYDFKLVPVTIRDVSLHLVASKLELPICCLPSCNVCNIKMWLDQQLFFIYWKDNKIPNIKNKQNKLELTDMIDFGGFPSLS